MNDNLYPPEGSGRLRQPRDLSTPERIERAIVSGEIFESRCILCDGEHNLHIDLGKYTGIIPREECVYSLRNAPVKDIAVISRVGKSVCFKIKDLRTDEYGRSRIILSRRDAQRECMENYIRALTSGRRHRRARDAPRAVRRVRGRGLRHRVAAVHRLHLGLAHLAPARPVHGGAVHQGRRPHAARRAGDDFGLAPRAARHMGGERRAVRRRTDGGRDHPLGRAVRRIRRADAQPRRTGGGQGGRRGGGCTRRSTSRISFPKK